MKNIKSKKWLAKNIEKDNVVILDARSELGNIRSGYEEFKKGHIKGARYVSLENTLTGQIKKHGGRHPLPDLDIFVEEMMNLGVNDNSIVVIYDEGKLSMAGRLWWMLRYIGKTNVYVLKGGYANWTYRDLVTTQEIKLIHNSGTLSLNIQESMVADIKDVKEAINNQNIAIIDSRSSERFSGEKELLDRTAGRIPTSINYPWTDLFQNKYKVVDDLNDYFSELKQYEELIVHCGSGITATVNILFMEELDLSPKLYVGGYSDWVSYKNNKIIVDHPSNNQ